MSFFIHDDQCSKLYKISLSISTLLYISNKLYLSVSLTLKVILIYLTLKNIGIWSPEIFINKCFLFLWLKNSYYLFFKKSLLWPQLNCFSYDIDLLIKIKLAFRLFKTDWSPKNPGYNFDNPSILYNYYTEIWCSQKRFILQLVFQENIRNNYIEVYYIV